MKYSELIQFEPLTTVIKLEKHSEQELKRNVETYVFSDKMVNLLNCAVTSNLAVNANDMEQKGISVVGSYGTGKSHLMSIISAIAEDEKMLQYLSNEEIKESFKAFAGKYKVLRFEVGNSKPLFELVCYRIEKFLKEIGVNFIFDPASNDNYKEQILQMMAAFEEKYPDKYFLVVIDELLEYLKSRDARELNGDLMTLRLLGQACDGSRFKLIYGVQELLYRDPMLAHAADTLNKVQDRYDDVLITKEDVAFVVKNRLLKKTPAQKQKIREHLDHFTHLFDGLNTNLNEYVELFPVHPSYIAQFQQIKHGKNQREILKTLSYRFESLKNEEIPNDNPGLVTYDSYFEDLKNDSSLLSIPDIATIKDKVEIINDKINSHFVGGRKNKKRIAERIANALAIKALCDDLDKHLGASAQTLKDDLCFTLAGIDNSDLLKDTIEATAGYLQKATQGQYVAKEENSEEYYIRTEGGINVEQIVKSYSEDVIKRTPELADQYFFNLLKILLGIEQNPYRIGFNIWAHNIEWKSTKSFRLGYVFFGNPDERSTTEPVQEFYMYFCPLFVPMNRNDNLEDEVYFDFSDFSGNFKEEICLYAASESKKNDASSNQKKLFETQCDEHKKRVRDLFNREFADKTKVIYKGNSAPLKHYQLPQEGDSKLELFSEVTANLLDSHFNEKFSDYPQFRELASYITPDNLEQRIKSALTKIVKFNQANRDGQAVLSGLGLLGINSIDIQNSKYADAIKKKLANKGKGKVLNRDEILKVHSQALNQYYSIDYNLDYQLEFVVLSALVFNGDIEITWNGNLTLNASNCAEKLLKLSNEDYFTFNTIKAPTEANLSGLKKLFNCLNIPNTVNNLQNDTRAFSELLSKSKEHCDNVVRTIADLREGINCSGVSMIENRKKEDCVKNLENLKTVLDSIQNYDTYGKIKNFKYSAKELDEVFKAYPICEEIKKLKDKSEKFENLINYLTQAKSYVLESELPLYDDICKAIDALPSKLHSDLNEQKRYLAQLNALKDSYADYYYKEYMKSRLNSDDTAKKERLANSERKAVCEIIKDVNILTTTEFENWRNTLTSLKSADPTLTKDKIKQKPYQDFNPRENHDKTKYSITALEEQLDKIFENWVQAMKATFNDPESKQTISMLDKEEQKLAMGFAKGEIEIGLNNAKSIRDIINNISRGFEKVELNSSDFGKIFYKPMNVNEAKEAFEQYLEKQCLGKEVSKIRIILSGK